MATVKHFRIVNPDCKIGRRVGGMAWPEGEMPGFVLILGERIPNPGMQTCHYHLLAEAQEFNPGDLVRICLELSQHYNVTHFYGQLENEHLVSYNLQARRIKEPEFHLEAHSVDKADKNWAQDIEERAYGDSQSLFLPPGSKINSFVHDLSGDDNTLRVKAYCPAVEALWYALTGLDTIPSPYANRVEEAPGQRFEEWWR